MTIHRNLLKTFYKKNLDSIDPLSYPEAISGTHILRQWNSIWLYPDFETNLKKFVRVATNPALIKLFTEGTHEDRHRSTLGHQSIPEKLCL